MSRKALIMIDYINDIVHPQGKIASCAKMLTEKNIIGKCNNILDITRKHNHLIIWIKVGFSHGYLQVSDNSPIFKPAKTNQALMQHTWGTELIEGLNYQENELVIFKNRINPFYATNLELILRVNQIEHIYLAGVATEWAVEAAARDAHDKDFGVSIIEDLCASHSLEIHNSSIKTMSQIAKIINSQEIC
ncbi:MAG TPA: isochorismatase family cysteine hydrolase [Aquella sp.]|nr:isochorismatase family cysteine hydrolase [Aquella sp.]